MEPTSNNRLTENTTANSANVSGYPKAKTRENATENATENSTENAIGD